MKKLASEFEQVNKYFEEKFSNNLSNVEILEIQNTIFEKVAKNWNITLYNDILAFMFTKQSKKIVSKKHGENAFNNLVSGAVEIESMKPVKELTNLANYAKNSEELRNVLTDILEKNDEEYLENYLKIEDEFIEFKIKFIHYINKYGNRCFEELKLETKTYKESKISLLKEIIGFIFINNLEKNEDKVTNKKGYKHWVIKIAVQAIRNREESRLNRARFYGMVRKIFLAYGQNFEKTGEIENREDIFYLTMKEISGMLENKQKEVKSIITKRRMKEEEYKNTKAFSRLVCSKNVNFNSHRGIESNRMKHESNCIQGIGVSSGNSTGKIIIINSPKEAEDAARKNNSNKNDRPWLGVSNSKIKRVNSRKRKHAIT
jgi:pyruvate,water dikinase